MNQTTTEKHSIKSAKEFLADYGDMDQDNGRHPTRVFKKNISEKLESIEYERYCDGH
jgi:hypothetical protein